MSKGYPRKTKAKARKKARPSRAPSSKSTGKTFDPMGETIQYRRTEKLFVEGETATCIYKVESGCIKTYNLSKDDRRHIRAFYLPGDCIGLEAHKIHDCSADAIAPSAVRAINKKTLMARAATDIALMKVLLEETSSELRRTRNHKALLQKSAQARVASFLLEISGREGHQSRIAMPVIRQELGDHLGLTFETVSRILWQLERAKIISLPERHAVIIKNMPALKRMSA